MGYEDRGQCGRWAESRLRCWTQEVLLFQLRDEGGASADQHEGPSSNLRHFLSWFAPTVSDSVGALQVPTLPGLPEIYRCRAFRCRALVTIKHLALSKDSLLENVQVLGSCCPVPFRFLPKSPQPPQSVSAAHLGGTNSARSWEIWVVPPQPSLQPALLSLQSSSGSKENEALQVGSFPL